MRGLFLVPVAATVLAFAIASGSPAQTAAAAAPATAAVDPDQETTTRVCGACHDISTVTQRRMSEDEWHAMVNRMVDMGAQATPQEIEKISAFVSKHYGLTPFKPATR